MKKEEFGAAMLMGRMLDLLRRAPGATADHKAALRSLLALVARRSLTVRLEEGSVSVEGVSVPSETPFVAVLISQMQVHGLAEIHIGHQATAVDLVQLLQALSPDGPAAGPGYSVEQRLRDGRAATVSVVSSHVAEAVKQRRQVRVTDALAGVTGGGAPSPGAEPLRVVSSSSATSRDGALEQQLAHAATLSPAINGLDDSVPLPLLQRQLEAIQASITKAFDEKRMDQAIDGLAALVRREAQAPNDQVRRAYALVLRWLLVERNLAKMIPHLLDELYQADALTILRGAGRDGTRVVVQHLAEAPTFAERRTLLGVVRQLEEGVEVIANMMGHHQWFVVRNMADLAGDLRIAEAVDALRHAVEHEDARVRKSAGAALAKIGTASAARGVVRGLRDPEQDVRLAVARAIGGEGLAGVIPSLLAAAEAEQDANTLYEYYRALGRIGTPAAVQALAKFAQPGGRIVGRRASAPRVAAVEGLGLVRGSGAAAARSALQALCSDSVKEVREAAKRAMAQSSA
jgi:HEAT repeat protein